MLWGAIARARQTIIVGDPKQLPPTNFFGRNEDEEDVIDYEKDLESILDEAKAAGLPVRDLRWHYRSRDEALIAFSNLHYYQKSDGHVPSADTETVPFSLKPFRKASMIAVKAAPIASKLGRLWRSRQAYAG